MVTQKEQASEWLGMKEGRKSLKTENTENREFAEKREERV
jgi:hypothetical protein